MKMRDTDRMMRTKLLGGALVSIFLLLFFSAVAGATMLAPGSAVSPVPAGTETGTLVATATGAYSTIDSIAGTVTEGVYAEAPSAACPLGCLDFDYQFTETKTTNPAFSFSGSDFETFYSGQRMFPSLPLLLAHSRCLAA